MDIIEVELDEILVGNNNFINIIILKMKECNTLLLHKYIMYYLPNVPKHKMRYSINTSYIIEDNTIML